MGRRRSSLEGNNGPITFSPDGSKIVSGSNDNTIRLWDAAGTPISILKGRTGWVNSVAFSPDGNKIVSGSDDCTVRLWDAAGTPFSTLEEPTGSVLSVAFSPDGRYLGSSSSGRVFRLWSVATGVAVAETRSHEEIVKMRVDAGKRCIVGLTSTGDVAARLELPQ